MVKRSVASSLFASGLQFAAAVAGENWEIVDGAVLRGTDFKDPSISWLGGRDVMSVSDCQALCSANSTCLAFDFVEELTQSRLSLEQGLSPNDCWFRLDDLWSISASTKRKHTSGRRALPTTTAQPLPTDAKNVIFVLFDDMRAMQNEYGWSQTHMPNHGRLLSESLIFDRAYVQQAVCGPSRASLMSGRRPDRTQMWNFIEGDEPGGFRNAPGATEWNTWPQYFGSRGYYVAGAGKLYHKGDPSHFDPPSWTEPECKENFPHSTQGTCPYDKTKLPRPQPGCPVDTKIYTNCTTGEVDCFPDKTALEKGLDFLRKGVSQYKSSGQPFWLGFGFVKPHVPHVYPKEFLDLVPAMDDIELPPNPNFTEGAPPVCWLKEGPAKGFDKPADEKTVKAFRQGYYAAAAFTDSLLGQLLDELDTLGVADSTAIIMTSDHGWGLGEHNHFLKYSNYETDARVPFAVRVPWKPATQGQRTSAIVELVDMYPSLAELAGVPVDLTRESLDGRSFAHLFDNPSADHKAAAYSQYPRCWPDDAQNSTAFTHMARCSGVEKTDFAYMGYSVRTSQWRYTEWAKWDGAKLAPNWDDLAGVELYDHAEDPPHNAKISFEQFENKNVANDFPDVVKQLSQQLHDFVAKGTNSMDNTMDLII